MTIRNDWCKVTLYIPLMPNHLLKRYTPTEVNREDTVFTFTIMFEHTNAESAWHYVHPMSFCGAMYGHQVKLLIAGQRPGRQL